jgi:putative acyl-CoA dehydrogenase
MTDLAAASASSTGATHEVSNQATPFEDVDLFSTDAALVEGLEREGAGWAVDRVRDAGIVAGSA